MNTRNLRAALVGVITAVLASGGMALAAGPGSGGLIQGCYDSGGNLKVIAALPCPKGYTALAWSQQGTKGSDGAPGRSAYQVWIALGNSGTEQDFIESLRGPAGIDGVDGNLALAGQECVQGRFVTGFDVTGHLICRLVTTRVVVDQGADCDPLRVVPGADYRNCDLRGVDLRGAFLPSSNLRGTNLSGANLSGADLHGSDLEGVSMPNADLRGANFTDTDMTDAHLSGADLSGATLRTNLGGANLTNANLTNADLTGAILVLAFLDGADMTNADLTGANLFPSYSSSALWNNTTCPDGTNSDDDGGTCFGHWV